MSRRLTGIAVAAVAALCALTGSAIAGGNGNGNNGNGNGNQPAAPAAAPAAPAAPGNSANAPGQQKKSTAAPTAPAKSSPSPGQAKHTSTAGVKPSSATNVKHWTTAPASSNKTKLYGNGQTAGQIATKYGHGDAMLIGPGNSQPHKIVTCGHPHGIDVHALKSHAAAKNCATSAPQQSTAQSTQVTQSCPATTSIVTSTHFVAKKEEHGHAYGEERKDRQEGKLKTTSVVVVQPAAGCTSSSTQAQASSSSAHAPAAAAGAANGTQASAPTASSTPSAGGVLGAQATLKRTAAPKAKAHGGVLGTVGNIAGTTLPFTGLQVWIAVLIAAGLILVGSLLYRRGRGASTTL
jgi:hypothetical protein